MRKLNAIFFLLLVFLPSYFLFSQSSDDPVYEEDWDPSFQEETYVQGDQIFIMSIGVTFPVLFIRDGEPIEHNLTPPVGGAGSLIYSYFLTSHVFLGLEISGIFNPTLGLNQVFLIPIGLKAGYQFNIGRFDIPLVYTIGINWHRYLNETYFGLYMKGGAGAYFRFDGDWSFGLMVDWCWFPEWTNDPAKDVHGNIIDLKLSARYHF